MTSPEGVDSESLPGDDDAMLDNQPRNSATDTQPLLAGHDDWVSISPVLSKQTFKM